MAGIFAPDSLLGMVQCFFKKLLALKMKYPQCLLSACLERKDFTNGDMARPKNVQIVLEAEA